MPNADIRSPEQGGAASRVARSWSDSNSKARILRRSGAATVCIATSSSGHTATHKSWRDSK